MPSKMLVPGFVIAAMCAANPLSTFTTGGWALCWGNDTNSPCNVFSAQDPNGRFVSTSGAFLGQISQLFASGSAGYGTLFSNSYNSMLLTSSENVLIQGSAAFEDILTVNYAPFTGQPGLLFLGYNIDGRSFRSLIDNAFAQVTIDVGPSLPGQVYSANAKLLSGGFVPVPIAFNFIYGQPFGLYMGLDTFTGTVTPAPGGGVNFGFASGGGYSQIVSGVYLSDVAIEDQSGDPVTGWTITSASGTQYGPNGVVPEPSSIALLITTAALSGLSARRLRGVGRSSPSRKSYLSVSGDAEIRPTAVLGGDSRGR